MIKNRHYYIDNLRTFIIILVILMHASVSYSRFGMWYYVEDYVPTVLSDFIFGIYLSTTQAFFMALMFMVSGYFIPATIEKKGIKYFVKNRIIRLGIPVVLYVLFLHPLSIKIANPKINVFKLMQSELFTQNMIGWLGPIWFALALLIFSLIYAFLRYLTSGKKLFNFTSMSVKHAILTGLLISSFSFLIRGFFPMSSSYEYGESVINMMLSYYPAYIALFSCGLLAGQSKAFDEIKYNRSKVSFMISLFVGLPAWCLIMLFLGPMNDVFHIYGNFTWQSWIYSLWEAFFTVTISIGLIGYFKEKWDFNTNTLAFMSRNSFPIYVFHTPILVGIAVLARGVPFPPVLKAVLASLIVIIITGVFTNKLIRVKFFRKIF